MNEADTCRILVEPKLRAAGWETPPHRVASQPLIAPGRIVPLGRGGRREPQQRPDYLLYYAANQPLAVVETKRDTLPAGEGMQQAKAYAEKLGLTFAFATNGKQVLEFDYVLGRERTLEDFPAPEELWQRRHGSLTPSVQQRLLTPYQRLPDKEPRYYQEIAINRVVQAILAGRRRNLLTLATGTGKTFVAFQICWRLWEMRWNRAGEHRRPKILFLSDRNILVDDPKDNMFAPFGDARHKIEGGKVVKSRDMYFAIYQAIAQDENRPGLYRGYAPDFFDLIVVDECHRGSARDDSNWREILEYFEPAYQLGMTATPLREDNRDTYRYFGNPLYTYSLRQGIEDGFLAPYRVRQVVSEWDASGWRPDEGQQDRFGREVPDELYQTKDFERVVALKARTEAIARHLTNFLNKSNRFDKTIVFCVDQEHADAMRHALTNLNDDLMRAHPDYVVRITADEGDIGRGHLGRFKDPEEETPVIATTSHLLTTGVDIPTCTNVVLARVIGATTEFKQIIGRGTRVREDHGKLFFNILDYTGSAMQRFADPAFDGEPAEITEEEIDEAGNTITVRSKQSYEQPQEGEGAAGEGGWTVVGQGEEGQGEGAPRKFYVDEGQVEIVAEMVYDLDADGRRLRASSFSDYAGKTVRTLYTAPEALHGHWVSVEQRQRVVKALAERGIDLDYLRQVTQQPEADPFDLLCYLAYGAPLRTRRERAERLRGRQRDFFDAYGPEARAILDELLDKYIEHGEPLLAMPDLLKVPPISRHGNVIEIMRLFDGPDKLVQAVDQMQALLYAA
ncbi:MAG: DEAD/DEAH box helicase family protein [Caldilineales bacterium]|nr:DEAD/DEAH box helicase family protein [Caldilineales bacterium]MCW5856935.1 DEAD/DEAH box helicase family protein [Caldilineales bacterium]